MDCQSAMPALCEGKQQVKVSGGSGVQKEAKGTEEGRQWGVSLSGGEQSFCAKANSKASGQTRRPLRWPPVGHLGHFSGGGRSLFEPSQPCIGRQELNLSVLLRRFIDFWQNTMSCFKGTAAAGLGGSLTSKEY